MRMSLRKLLRRRLPASLKARMSVVVFLLVLAAVASLAPLIVPRVGAATYQ